MSRRLPRVDSRPFQAVQVASAVLSRPDYIETSICLSRLCCVERIIRHPNNQVISIHFKFILFSIYCFLSKNNCSGSRCFLCRTITHCKNDRYVTDIKARPNIIKRQHPTTPHCSTDVCAQAAASVAQSTKTTLRTAHPSVPVYNSTDNSPVRHPRPTLPPAPAYNAAADSSVCAASDVAVIFTVYFSRPGLYQHTRPHLSARRRCWMVQMGRRTSRRH